MKSPIVVSYPPDPNPHTPRLKLPSGAWDTHFHAVGPPQLYPYIEDRHHTPPAAPIEHYIAVAKVLGFERGVVMQHGFHGHDYAITLNAIRKSDGRFKGMILADPALDDGDIRKLHKGGIRGVRVELSRQAVGSFEDKRFERVVSRAANASWVVALHLNPDSIVRFADVIRRMPGPTIIENYALVDARKGLDQPALRTLLDLAGEPHIWLKAASAYRMILRGASYEQVLPIARAVHARSPDRTIWGTDWPHGGVYEPGRMPNDGDLVDTLIDFVPDETARHKLLVDNPKRLFASDEAC
jgi:2-pyrone-4,6-dicarboxylate lactonase